MRDSEDLQRDLGRGALFCNSLFIRYRVYYNCDREHRSRYRGMDRPAGLKPADSTCFLGFCLCTGVDFEKFSSLVSQNSPRRLRPRHCLDVFYPCRRIQGHRSPSSPLCGSTKGDFRSARTLERPGVCSERIQSRGRQSSCHRMDCLARVSAPSRSYRRRRRKPGALANP
jgi:hypothetical protein